MAILKAKLHPVLAGVVAVVAFVSFTWVGLGMALGGRNVVQALGEGWAMEQQMNQAWNTTAAVTPAIDAQQPTGFETATFAVG